MAIVLREYHKLSRRNCTLLSCAVQAANAPTLGHRSYALENVMFTHILFPTDGSELSDKAAARVMELARVHGGRVTAISVIQPFPFMTLSGDSGIVAPDAEVYESQMERAARDNVNKVAAAASASGVPFEGLVALSPSPYQEIVAAAEKHGCDAIVMASHGRKGLNKLFLGSETQKVLAHTQLPVLVLR